LHEEDFLLIPFHPSRPLDETDRVQNIQQILHEEHTRDRIVSDPKRESKNESSEVNNSATKAKVGSPEDEVRGGVVVTRGEEHLEDKSLAGIAELKEREDDDETIDRGGELSKSE
jgi:hypothetical protein